MRQIFTHGSDDSLDHDVYVIFDDIPTFKEAKEYCNSLPELNPNILVLKDGLVDWCFKGTVDECNNSLFLTYHLHEQEHPLPIVALVPRERELKIVRTIRGLVSYFSRTELRLSVKKALRSSSWEEKRDVLRQCSLSRSIDFVKTSHTEVFKFYAFQMGQTRSLIEDNEELFTKKDVALKYPVLEPFLMRKEDADETQIHIFFQSFIDYLDDNLALHDNSYTFQYSDHVSDQFEFLEINKF